MVDDEGMGGPEEAGEGEGEGSKGRCVCVCAVWWVAGCVGVVRKRVEQPKLLLGHPSVTGSYSPAAVVGDGRRMSDACARVNGRKQLHVRCQMQLDRKPLRMRRHDGKLKAGAKIC